MIKQNSQHLAAVQTLGWLKVTLICNIVLLFLIPSNQQLQHFSDTARDLRCCAGYWQIMVEVSAALDPYSIFVKYV